MEQVWHDLLFAHWRVAAHALRALVPPALELDTFEGEAWVGVVPFRMTGVRVRGLPPVPGTNAFAELNLRTYVRHRGKSGVHFFALDAESALAVRGARFLFHLPYYDARMQCRAVGDDVEYDSVRTHPGAEPARFTARYGPTGDVFRSVPGTLDHWFTERYCLFAVDAKGGVHRADIHHRPWPLQPAHATIEIDTLPAAHGISIPREAPRLHFARRLDVFVWAPEREPDR